MMLILPVVSQWLWATSLSSRPPVLSPEYFPSSSRCQTAQAASAVQSSSFAKTQLELQPLPRIVKQSWADWMREATELASSRYRV